MSKLDMQLNSLQAEPHVSGFLGYLFRDGQRSLGGLPALVQEQVHFISLQFDSFLLQSFWISDFKPQRGIYGV